MELLWKVTLKYTVWQNHQYVRMNKLIFLQPWRDPNTNLFCPSSSWLYNSSLKIIMRVLFRKHALYEYEGWSVTGDTRGSLLPPALVPVPVPGLLHSAVWTRLGFPGLRRQPFRWHLKGIETVEYSTHGKIIRRSKWTPYDIKWLFVIDVNRLLFPDAI